MAIRVYRDLVQGSDEWAEARRGLLTASEMKLILTPTLKVAKNEKTRAHVYEIAAQRISGHVEPSFISDDMLRGMEDEIYARDEYRKHYAPTEEVGFITNDRWGFTLGYSPDGLVGGDGLIEIKSRRQKYQVETIIAGSIPDEFMLQLQTGLLVSERKWIDFISYSGGLPMAVVRALPDEAMQAAIIEAATAFEAEVTERVRAYSAALKAKPHVPTERRAFEEIRL